MNRSSKILLLSSLAFLLLCTTGGAFAASADPLNPPLAPDKPNLKFPTLGDYERAIKEPGVKIESGNVVVFAPRRLEQAARIIQDTLNRAYNELYRIVGTGTKYKIVVYHFAPGNPKASGGTSECVIYYDYNNLDLARSSEWTQYRVPHVSGYIEEMAHNFVSATHAQFGWEMVGWSIGTVAASKVAGNPIHAREVSETLRGQAETFARYRSLGFTFPADLPANQCDRIHAYLMWQSERKYGPAFWHDFFAQVRQEARRFEEAGKLDDGDQGRNARYRITLDCFDRLPGIQFKKLLADNGISLNVDVKSLYPTDPGWNREFIESAPEPAAVPEFDPASLPPLHRAAYQGEEGAMLQMIERGADVRARSINDWTPLHMSAMGGHQGTCDDLLKKGADIHARDKQGHTPADLAKLRGHEGTAEFLRQKEEGK